MDLGKLSTEKLADEGVFMPLRSPVDGTILHDEESGNPVGITLLGEDSQDFQAYQHKIVNRRLREQSGKGKTKLTAEELEAEAVELLIRVTRSFHYIVVDGVKYESNARDYRRLYTNRGLRWIREQVDTWVVERENYMGNLRDGSSEPPSPTSS